MNLKNISFTKTLCVRFLEKYTNELEFNIFEPSLP